MNVIVSLWAETIALFVALSAIRATKAFFSNGGSMLEAFLHGMYGQIHWHVRPKHLIVIAYISDIYLAILALVTIVKYVI